jgi:hypothetical protein
MSRARHRKEKSTWVLVGIGVGCIAGLLSKLPAGEGSRGQLSSAARKGARDAHR